jgi:hypothetical protein
MPGPEGTREDWVPRHPAENRSTYLATLWENSRSAFHARLVMKRTDIGVSAGVRKRRSEACNSQGRLRETDPFLRRGYDKAGVHTVGG